MMHDGFLKNLRSISSMGMKYRRQFLSLVGHTFQNKQVDQREPLQVHGPMDARALLELGVVGW